jgi:hypothetical protein
MKKLSKIKESIVQGHRETIRKENEATSVEARFGGMISFMQYFLYPVLLIWTGSTAALFMYTSMTKASTSVIFGAFCAIMLAGVIEGIKYYTGKKIVNFFAHGWYKEGIHNVFLSIPILILVIAAFGGSVYLAVKGSPLLSDNIIEGNGIALVSTDSINTYFDGRIKSEQDKQNAAHRTTWHGVITTDAVRLSKSIQTTIDRIEKQRTSAIDAAEKENAARKAGTKEFSKIWGSWLSGFGGWAELLQVVILIFSCLYSRYVYIEDMEDDDQNTQLSGIGFRNKQSSNPAINNNTPHNNSRTIIRGFHQAQQQPESFVITRNEAVSDSVVTDTIMDIESNIKLKVQRIRQYLSKWRSRDGGTSETIKSNLRQDWEEIEALCRDTQISEGLYNTLVTLRTQTEQTLKQARPRKIR